MRFDAYLPTRLVFGPGRLVEAGTLARNLGHRAFVVTTRTAMARLGYTNRLVDCLQAAGLDVTLFSELDLTPTTDNVDLGCQRLRQAGSDLVIGSPALQLRGQQAVYQHVRRLVDHPSSGADYSTNRTCVS